jgi:hypothetical protein
MTEALSTQRIASAIQLALGSVLDPLGLEEKARVLANLGAGVDAEVRRERDRCVELCRGRAELWGKTLLAQSPVASAKEEARARSNEARYLADLLDTASASEPEADA